MDIALSKRKSAFRRAGVRLCVWFLGVVVLWGLGCSSDTETPVGAELVDDILGSKPGVTRYDTLSAVGDTVYTYYTLIDKDAVLQVGSDSGYVRSMILRPDFSSAGSLGDLGRTVETAELRVVRSSNSTVLIQTRFYHLDSLTQVDLVGNPTGDMFVWGEGDGIKTIDTLGVLIDPTTGNARRNMIASSALYPIDSLLAQEWIRGEAPNNGILVVYDAPDDELALFSSRESGDEPTFKVVFTDGIQRFYPISADGTFMRPQQTTSNLIISDGFVRRINLTADLSPLSDSAAVHNALFRLHIVPDTDLGLNLRATLYIPDSSDPTSDAFLTGAAVSTEFVDVTSGVLDFRGINMTIAFQDILEGEEANNGFALKFQSENTELRQVEFYTGSSTPDSLRPRFFLTTSSPAEYDQ